MSNIASYIFSAYSSILKLPLRQIIDVGNSEKNSIPIPSFDEDILIKLCKEAKEVFQKEDNVLKIEGDVIVVGDIHGSFHDLLRILKYVLEQHCKVLFLGDYVDRGQFSLECITILFAMKVLRPYDFFLIRGNHEFDSICNRYGFKDEIISYIDQKKNKGKQKFENQDENIFQNGNVHQLSYTGDSTRYHYTMKLYRAFIKAFSYLPISAIINNTTFCIHGGLSPKLQNIETLDSISRPIDSFVDDMLLTDLLWGDPSTLHSSPYHPSPRGHGYLFNESSVTKFLNDNSLKRIIRAHQFVQNGISEHFGKKCITVFSASSYSNDLGNESGILKISEFGDTIRYKLFEPIHRLSKYKAFYDRKVLKSLSYYSIHHYSKPVSKRKTTKLTRIGATSTFTNSHSMVLNKRTSYQPKHAPSLNISHSRIHKSFSMTDIKNLNE